MITEEAKTRACLDLVNNEKWLGDFSKACMAKGFYAGVEWALEQVQKGESNN